jgi:hypothetical protein
MAGESAAGPLGLAGAAAWIIANADAVRDHLVTYTTTYAGRSFEWFAQHSDPARFTAEDMLAVSALSVDVPTGAARALIADHDGRFGRLLWRAQVLVTAADAPTGLADMDLDGELSKTLSDLYALIRGLPGVGKVSTSKLLAAKFPAHVPIRDARVEQILGLANSREWWAPMQQLLNSAGVLKLLTDVEMPDDRPYVTTLRRLDIVLWRQAEQRGLG